VPCDRSNNAARPQTPPGPSGPTCRTDRHLESNRWQCGRRLSSRRSKPGRLITRATRITGYGQSDTHAHQRHGR
jgi:hypothetical protein